jgi:hypothetical protein
LAKKISSATIKEIIKENNKEDKKIILKTADAEIEVVIKPYISYQERTQMVNDIASECYDEIGNYHPEFFDIAYKIALIEHFTNINTDIKDSVNQMHILCESTDLIEQLHRSIGNIVGDIVHDAQAIIKWRNEQSLKSNAWDDVAYMISGLLDKLADRLDKMPEASKEDADKFAALTAKLGNMSEDKIIDGILKFHNKDN